MRPLPALLSLLLSAGVLQAQGPRNAGVERVVLRVDALAGPGAPGLDTGSLDREVRLWLAKAGIALVDEAQADPLRTHFLKLVVRTSHGEGSINVCKVRGECSLLADFRKVDGGSGQPGTLRQVHHFLGQRGEAGFAANLDRMVKSTLAGLFALNPEALPEAPSDGKAGIVDFPVSRLRVRSQPSAPRYPLEAKMKGIQGTAVVSVLIDPTGKPFQAEAVSGFPELMEEAIRYALKWEFEPEVVDGEPRTVRFQLTMPFRLH